MQLINAGRITGELAVIAVVVFFATSWLYLTYLHSSNNVVILTLEEHRLQRDTMHRALAEVQRLRAELEACLASAASVP